jgi:hypothetical protein
MWTPGPGEGGVHDVAVQPDGRIVAAGSTEFGARETLARFLPSGQPDQSFAAGGFVTTTIAPAFTLARPGVDVALVLTDLVEGTLEVVAVPTLPPAADLRPVVTPRGGACDQTLTFVVTRSLGSIAAGQDLTAMSVGTSVTGSEEGLFGTARVTSNTYDPDLTDNIVTTEVVLDGGHDGE